MCRFYTSGRRVKEGWDGTENLAERCLFTTFSQECAWVWGYTLGY